MTNIGELYACRICGNTVEVVGPGAGRLVCCGQDMDLSATLTTKTPRKRVKPAFYVNRKTLYDLRVCYGL
ncbi:MAG TPA: desulfoferrodoxin FeS4 iron-binding domain-containing protein [Candidatus Bathyarchaeia archaeon]|nr:desulfoferrodoxin FeS4 iron-binding domain-containing protein [Candidatus Bathyarchaeia archaeon]